MKIFFLFFLFLFSSSVFSAQTCVVRHRIYYSVTSPNGNTATTYINCDNPLLSQDVEQCNANPPSAETICTGESDTQPNGVSYSDLEMVCYYLDGVTSCARINDTPTSGTWDPKTLSCSNYVTPSVDSSGVITCPAPGVTVANSTVNTNPSKDDVACDPSKPIDPLKPQIGCASEKTAIKSNELISESNSKLGSIASIEATNIGLLSSIKNILERISGQGTLSNSTGGSGSNGDTGTAPDLSDDSKYVGSVSSSMSGFGSCPLPPSFYVFGKSYEFSYQPLCDAAQSIRGLVIAVGAFSALLIVVTAL